MNAPRKSDLPQQPAKPSRAIPACLFVLLPVLLVSALLLPMGATVKDCIPYSDDEVHQWNDVSIFKACGFRGGYTTADEKPAPAGWCHFGPHGPGFAVLYGGAAKLVGWRPWSGPVFNIVVLAVASLVWAWSVRFEPRVLTLGCFFIATSWPLLLYLPTTLQESLHAAFAMLIAATIRRKSYWLTFALIVVAALVRVTWALVLIPWVTLFFGETERKSLLKLSALAVAGVAVLFLTSRYLSSPYPGAAPDFFTHLATFTFVGHDLQQTIFPNLIKFPFEDKNFLDEVQRLEILDLIVVGLVFFRNRPYPFVAVSLLVVVIPVAALYQYNSYRILFPHVLLACLVLLGCQRFEVIKVLIVVHLSLVLWFVGRFRELHAAQVHAPVTQPFDWSKYIRYDPNAADPYANTLFVPDESMDSRWLSLPPGIGISTLVMDYVQYPKSKYVFLPPRATSKGLVHLWMAPAAMKEMDLLCHTEGGDVYVKREAEKAP